MTATPSPTRSGRNTRLLTRLGVPRLWGADIDNAWLLMRFNVVPITTRWCAPGSFSYGFERLPRSGGAVLALNHLSAIDPPLVGSFSVRPIRYMTKADLLEIPLVGEALEWVGGFPVRRDGNDSTAIRNARDLVRAGHLVGIFVEGSRQRLGYPGHVQAGALMVAMKERVPVIPCGLETFGWSPRNRRACAIVCGEPMTFQSLPANGFGYKQAAEQLRSEITRLWRQAAHAVADGFPAHLPDGTARTSWPRARDYNRQQSRLRDRRMPTPSKSELPWEAANGGRAHPDQRRTPDVRLTRSLGK